MNSPRQSLPNRDNKSPFGDSQVRHKKFEEFAARLAQSAQNQGYNAFRLGQKIGVARATMARYWSGERIAPAETLFQLSELLDVDAKWLATGKSSSDSFEISSEIIGEREARLLRAFRRLNDDQQEHLVQTADMLSQPRTLHDNRQGYRAPPPKD